ncbi:single-stranded-DNA-specific exonuclease RecJ [Riemerella anatipestifer]|uniref:Single-stranded-DNA-specific exonuclease RecJ n=1 Tax=Riemerella anatipestifer TaxID=34085 RepID=A0AAP3AMM4_RIEAN|nr:single-stranded-DNA-specific exonuclease RecJ [Riemerella anatipestifer]AZZ59225.1 single-stranded-DNA-specific exonuclease RecJ [Riemerella anatipestifer]MBT0552492.1 single-stranded-DNA-specific exonuclease RecJ [Riemerella anatipestifer]MBT0554805.1 single-stranded-DNA-specific exonuclease RecJ [Riemerella anatipestifer]MBT0573798.1 single-stranded-DNA-specific exonuclease RecJ [Riemerella anatipestifer]MCO7319498.1 single-stranded-DNA-specific exonuclease RecJ [Riemerella anatipestifer]
MNQKWIYKPEPSEEVVDALISSIGYGTLESKILVLREIDNYQKAREFFKPNLEDIHNPFLMADMQNAVERIATAIENGEKILVYGDYDVDGTTAVALMYLYLSKIVEKKYLDFYIPDRNTEGYGISKEGIDFAKENGFSLIIALDCGIKAIDKIDYAKELGIDFIICDHHLPGENIPKAVAVLDPKRTDCRYPFKELSGCGVGFKLCQGLNNIYKIPDEELYELTDLLAISIAADIVSMTGENRVLAKLGLKTLRKTRNLGIRLLIPKEKLATFDISNIVFEIAPKINAAGRISHGKAAVELMVSDNLKHATQIVENILNLNDHRREMDMSSTTAALQQVIDTQQIQNATTVVYGSDWNKGVIGIVASRLTETYYKPTVVFTDGNNGEIVASARSVSDFDVHAALEECSDLFLKFGGHPAAAGLSMEKEKFELFKEKFEKTVAKNIKEHQKEPSITIDTVVDIDDLNKDFYNFHRKLAPFGPHNMKPILVLKNLNISGHVKQMGKDNSHIKFYIQNPNNKRNIECVGFKLGHFAEEFRNKTFDLAFTVEENHWKGNVTYYLNIKGVKFS